MKHISKKIVAIMGIITIAISMQGTVFAAKSNLSEVLIKIVHTNDTHGRAYGGQDNPWEGTPSAIAGFDKVKAVANSSEYGGKKADFIIDAGDLFHGLSFATMDKGDSIAKIVKAVGYDAITPGNHDWNYGQAQLKNFEAQGIKMLAGNIANSQGDFFKDEVVIKAVDGVNVGVFGVSDPDVNKSVAPYNIEGLSFGDKADYANKAARKIKKDNNCDIAIAIYHGMDPAKFASQTRDVDVIIAGHEHVVADDTVKNADNKDVKIVEAGYYFNNIGVLSLTYNKNTNSITGESKETVVSAKDAGKIDISKDTEAQSVKTLMNEINNSQALVKNQKIGETSTALPWSWADVRVDEQPIGQLITDSYLAISGADFAFENAGGIRAGLEKGNITRGNVIDISPFGNYLETRKVKGAHIREALETSLEIQRQSKEAYDIDPDANAYPTNSGSYLHGGGFVAKYDMTKPRGKRIVSINLVKSDKTQVQFGDDTFYTVVMSNFLATSKDFPQFTASEKIAEYSSCEEAIIAFVRQGDGAIQASVNQKRMMNTVNDVVTPEETTTQVTTTRTTAVQTTQETATTASLTFSVCFLPCQGWA